MRLALSRTCALATAVVACAVMAAPALANPPELPSAPEITATRTALGAIVATWPAAVDGGTGVDHYEVCVNNPGSGLICELVPFDSSATSVSHTFSGVPNDGLQHDVTVVAFDSSTPADASNQLLVSILMPIPATPVIALQGGDGCTPLIASLSSPEQGSQLHLYVGDPPKETSYASPIIGSPYQPVTLTALATAGVADQSLPSPPVVGRIGDLDGPETAPQVHGQAVNSTSEALFWDPLPAVGAPVVKYVVTSAAIPGFENGVDVPVSATPGITLSGLAASRPYPVQVTAFDACNRPSPVSNFPPFRLNDVQSPTTPVLGRIVTTGSTVSLTWAPSSDDVAVDDYTIFVNGVAKARTSLTTYTFSGLGDFFSASYQIRATDTVGNQSALSAPRLATTKDMTPPSPPAGALVIKDNSDGNVTLGWGAATDNAGVIGYQVSRDGRPVQNVLTLTYTDKNVPLGPHHWEVRAYDAANLFSTPKSKDATSTGTPKTVMASGIRVVKTSGTKMVKVGGAAGARVVLSFAIPDDYVHAFLRVHVLQVVPLKARPARSPSSGKATIAPRRKIKLRVSLPLGSGRTRAGKRLAERLARKGTILIPLGTQKTGMLRLVVTATGGVITLAGRSSSASKAPVIQPRPTRQKMRSTVTAVP